ncbi:nuclease-related domain-containing protein [Leifsonia sp. ZF2019]|uniref:nuclease-related domain-containing protein n=1 Tax=Leifsonia sp. ZF2019 TaxID=2781978 RepID=UPI001CBC86D2|nr:nuclease-related domain-containing protein [Leifsonia sp. ZF2019]
MDSGRMSDRAPGAAVMAQVVRLHDAAPPRTPFARALGVTPLADETVPWFVGALGEREIGARLARLPDGWRVFHALPVGSGDADLDHLVVGPAGVFVIDTTHHRGARVWVAQRSMRVNGATAPSLRNADLEASRVRGLLATAGIQAPVRAVVAVVGAKELRIRQRPRSVEVVRGEELVSWLTRRPPVTDAAAVDAVTRLVDEPGTWRTAGQPADVADRFARIESEVRSARLVRAGWAVAAGLALFAAVLPFVPR